MGSTARPLHSTVPRRLSTARHPPPTVWPRRATPPPVPATAPPPPATAQPRLSTTATRRRRPSRRARRSKKLSSGTSRFYVSSSLVEIFVLFCKYHIAIKTSMSVDWLYYHQ